MNKNIRMNKKKGTNYSEEYSEIFRVLGIQPENIQHEWNKEGDQFKECSLYENHPTPQLTPNTHNI